MNLHTPERGADESQAAYRARRAASKAEAKRITSTPKQAPAINQLDVARFFTGQHKNPVRSAARHAKRTVKAWKREQHPKLAAPRVHKPHQHTLRDGSGQVVTLVGRDPLRHIGVDGRAMRRTWLAGISAQRGY